MPSIENKIPPPVIAGVFAAAMWGLSFIGPAIGLNEITRSAIIFLLIIFGIILGVLGLVSFRQAATTIDPLHPEETSALVTNGIYRISRNPMYVGLALFLGAWAVYLHSAWSIVGIPGFVLFMNRFQIGPEEKALSEIFGPEYKNYQSKVRRWF
jgi:protein-S-isoprenylcysteine O-methyltransferase Ste14